MHIPVRACVCWVTARVSSMTRCAAASLLRRLVSRNVQYSSMKPAQCSGRLP